MMQFRLIAFLALAAMVFCSAAQARARDDVMSDMFRCNKIRDDRTWLDCYYGAAQSQRAALGLPPAPAGQLRLVMSPPDGGDGQPSPLRDGVIAAAFGCRTAGPDRAWLDCYYAAAQPLRASLGLAARPAIAATPMAPAAVSREGGLLHDILGGKNAVVRARMTSYRFDHFGIFTVTLANNQIWRQLRGDTLTARWRGPASRYLVIISHGSFGSFNLKVDGAPALFKVERVE